MRRPWLVAALLVAAGVSARAGTLASRPAAEIGDSGIAMDWTWADLDAFSSTVTVAALDLYAGAGVKWARVRPEWQYAEPSTGTYFDAPLDNLVSQLRARGVKILLTVDGANQGLYGAGNAPTAANLALTPWLNWVDHLAARYGGSVSAWEIWNEPNLTWAPSVSAEAAANYVDYVALVQQTSDKIRSRVPGAYVVLGGTSWIDNNFFQKVVPSVGGRIDAVGIHPYRNFPEQSQDAWAVGAPNGSYVATGAADYFAEVAKLRQILSTAGFPGLAIWSTEVAFPTRTESGVWTGSVNQQAKNLAKYYVSNLSLGVVNSAWWRVFDYAGYFGNILTPPGSAWVDDYNNVPGFDAHYTFGTFSPAYPDIPASTTQIAGTGYTSGANILNLAVSTVTATSAFPNNSVTYTVSPAAGDYAVWLRLASTVPSTIALAACQVNGSTYTVRSGMSFNYLAINNLPATYQGKTTFDAFYYSPCLYYLAGNGALFEQYSPVVYHFDGSPTALTFQLLGSTTKLGEVRLVPLGALKEKPALTALRSLTALFDDRVGLTASLGATFSQGTMSGPEWAAFRSAAFTTRGGVPLVAYWIGQQPVDSLADRTAGVTLSAPLEDAIVIDPVAGTYAQVGSGKANAFTVRVQDYPLILTSASTLQSIASNLLLAEETYNYPNPVRGDSTYLRFYLTKPSDATVEVFDGAHQRLFSTALSAAQGRNVVRWPVTSVANGVYFMKVSAGSQSVVKKVIVLR